MQMLVILQNIIWFIDALMSTIKSLSKEPRQRNVLNKNGFTEKALETTASISSFINFWTTLPTNLSDNQRYWNPGSPTGM